MYMYMCTCTILCGSELLPQICNVLQLCIMTAFVAQLVKHLPSMQYMCMYNVCCGFKSHLRQLCEKWLSSGVVPLLSTTELHVHVYMYVLHDLSVCIAGSPAASIPRTRGCRTRGRGPWWEASQVCIWPIWLWQRPGGGSGEGHRAEESQCQVVGHLDSERSAAFHYTAVLNYMSVEHVQVYTPVHVVVLSKGA